MYSIFIGFLFVAGNPAHALEFQGTPPFQQSRCAVGNFPPVELLLRFDKKIPAEENDFFGAPLVFIKSLRDSKPQIVEPLTQPYAGEFSYTKQIEASICDKTQGYKLSGSILAILYVKDDRPLQDLTRLVVYDAHAKKILEKKELGAVSKMMPLKTGFAFSMMAQRSDAHPIEMRSSAGRKMSAVDQDLGAFQSVRFEDGKLKIEFDPELSFEKSRWKKYFKNQSDYFKSAGWDPKNRTFKNTVVYEASHFDRKESDFLESCMVMTDRRGGKIEHDQWKCLKEKH